MIDHLIEVNDKLIRKVKKEDLKIIQSSNRYYSPEVSETDVELIERNIVIKDLKWRSQTVSQKKLGKKVWNRVCIRRKSTNKCIKIDISNETEIDEEVSEIDEEVNEVDEEVNKVDEEVNEVDEE
ncbi:17863_t:CDS:2 [Racocetra fulgida]|uniref:17863_t:CDS:1 n=1 Tax=Racocetra fulgida TaxID=60492 RepID=A0A9N9BG74_9GLOM|nr:17863_t:CDS:2 [Racocetra fulgida]